MAIIGFNGSCPYSIGQHIITHDSAFNPNSIYVGTDWSRIKGRGIVGVDESQPEFNVAGKAGGTKTTNVSHSHTTGNCTLTVAQMPSHRHGYGGDTPELTKAVHNYGSIIGGGGIAVVNPKANPPVVQGNYMSLIGGGNPHNHGSTDVGGSIDQIILNPYISEYIWKRNA